MKPMLYFLICKLPLLKLCCAVFLLCAARSSRLAQLGVEMQILMMSLENIPGTKTLNTAYKWLANEGLIEKAMLEIMLQSRGKENLQLITAWHECRYRSSMNPDMRPHLVMTQLGGQSI